MRPAAEHVFSCDPLTAYARVARAVAFVDAPAGRALSREGWYVAQWGESSQFK